MYTANILVFLGRELWVTGPVIEFRVRAQVLQEALLLRVLCTHVLALSKFEGIYTPDTSTPLSSGTALANEFQVSHLEDTGILKCKPGAGILSPHPD